MRRPTYSVVTGCTVVVAAVCALRLTFERYIPPPRPKIATWARGDYVLRGEETDIDWKPANAETYAEAQRRSRPLVVVVGLPWSAVARQADLSFKNPDVARALNRGFIAVRVDAARDPRWLSQILPLQRAQGGFSLGFQVWIFDLKNRLIDYVARTKSGDDLRGNAMLDALLRAQSEFAEAVLADDPPDLEKNQLSDAERLLVPAVSRVNLADTPSALLSGIDPSWGGWNVNGIVAVRPLAYRFLQIAGRGEDTGNALRRLITSPCADWLDGAVYRVARADIRTPEYDKPTVTNAWLAETLAIEDALRPDPVLRVAARRTVRWLLSTRADSLVPGAEMGDEDERGRSARASFPPWKLRDLVSSGTLTAEDRRWVEDRLGVGQDARILVPTPDAILAPRFDGVLKLLRTAAGPPRTPVALGLCDINATVTARLLGCARLWNDQSLANAAGELVDRLEAFQPNEGLRHSLSDGPEVPGYLGDALAYADAQLADFLTNGRVPSLERGAAMLRYALRTYGGPESGVLRPSPKGSSLLPGMPELPEVTDDEHEALSAAALRLLDAYAAILGPAASDLSQAANDVGASLAAAVDALPPMGGALGALTLHAEDRVVLVVGPDAQERASRLARRLPTRLVAPVLGPARPDLRGKPRGVYIVSADGLVGPMSDEAAIRNVAETRSPDG